LIDELYGAGDQFRTGDLVLGKHTLYQLSYTRSPDQLSTLSVTCGTLVNASSGIPLCNKPQSDLTLAGHAREEVVLHDLVKRPWTINRENIYREAGIISGFIAGAPVGACQDRIALPLKNTGQIFKDITNLFARFSHRTSPTIVAM
jgi:hypothetical protein